MALQHLRSSTADKRPTPGAMSDGQLAINTNAASTGLFFKDSAGALVKVGPVHVGTTAPNATPAVGGQSGNTVGEQWLDTSGGTYVFKVWDGSAWRSEAGEFVNSTGDTMTGDLTLDNANIVFEGSTADTFETTLTVADPTADNTITLPDASGTVVTTGDTGSVTSTMIADATIVNADISASAEIAVSKLADGTARQLLQTDAAGTGVEWTSNVDVPGTLDVTSTATFDSIASHPLGSAGAPTITFTGDTNTGIYSPGADQLALSNNGTERMRIGNDGNINVGGGGITARVSAASAATSTPVLYGYANTASYTSTVIQAQAETSAGTAWNLYLGYASTGNLVYRVYGNGNVQNTNNSYGAISDAKLKENIVDAGSQWDDLKALQVRKYNFKEGQTHTQIGLVAQEVELVSPGLVTESPDRDAKGNDLGTVTKSVNYSVLYMKAVKALQEAMERIETLEAKVAALESA